MELGKIIDDNSDDDNTNTSTINNNHSNKNGEALSKGGILEKVRATVEILLDLDS